jgi:transcriptional regulator with XRE-family HTH domain
MPPREEKPTLTRIESLRLEAGLTQAQLAEKADISLRTLQRIEHRDTANPAIRALANIAIALGTDLESVIEPAWREWLPNSYGERAKRRRLRERRHQ